jgi:GT2 family glycosyltransferase
MREIMIADPRIASVCASCIHPDTGIAETAGIERFASSGDRAHGYDIVNIAAGGSLLRMEAIRQTDGYGAVFFWGREENDLAFQLLQRRWRVVYYPDAVVWHTLSPTGRDNYRRLEYVTRNSIWLLWKYFPLLVAIPIAKLFALRRLLAVVKDIRRLLPVLRGIVGGARGMIPRRREGRRFTLREAWGLRGWIRKLIRE